MQSEKSIANNKQHYKIIGMPGSGGNFLTRCLNLHPEINSFMECVNKGYAEKFNMLNYSSMKDRKIYWHPKNNWVKFELAVQYIAWLEPSDREGIKNVVSFEHSGHPCDIRITTLTRDEFDWCKHQALYKNTNWCLSYFREGQFDNQKVAIPCKNLWDFERLSNSLSEIEEYIGVGKNDQECRSWQKKLWSGWKETWAPEQIKSMLDDIFNGPKN